MYHSDPAGTAALAVTASGAAASVFNLIAAAVLIFAGIAALTVHRQLKLRRATSER